MGRSFGTQSMWLWTLVGLSAAHWKERSTRHCYKQCVVYMGSVPENDRVKLPFSFPLLFSGRLPLCMPIVLTQLYIKYDVFWQLKPSALLACHFQNVSKCGKLSAWHGGLAKAGDHCASEIIAVKYLFCNMKVHLGWTLRVGDYFSEIFISPDVVDCVKSALKRV